MSFDDLFSMAAEMPLTPKPPRVKKTRVLPSPAEGPTPAAAPQPAASGDDPPVLTVSALTGQIRMQLEAVFTSVWVEGEISTLRQPQSGHLYFTLKDDKAQLRCVMFRSASGRLKFQVKDGMACVVRGKISVYDAGGQYQLYVEKIEPRGTGALQLAFEQLKKKLSEEGLFAEERKRPLPLLPQTVGIATSATGAAIRDMLQVINRRYANVHIILRPCLVQGKTAAVDIAQAIAELNEHGRPEVIIVGRGGGSMEDLWPFNEEVVARAVAASRVPVISAVGHEIDFTICDFVADMRAPTPSAAAELVVQEKHKLRQSAAVLAHRIQESLQQKLRLAALRLERIGASYALQRPQVIIRQYQQRLDAFSETMAYRVQLRLQRTQERLTRACSRLVLLQATVQRLQQHLEQKRQRMDSLLRQRVDAVEHRLAQSAARLTALNPLAVLGRGYSVTSDENGRVLRRSDELGPGAVLRTRLYNGTIISRVEECRS